MCRPDGRHVFLKGKVQMITYLHSTCCVDFMKIVLSFYCQHNNSTPQHIIPNMLIPILSFQAQMILRLI